MKIETFEFPRLVPENAVFIEKTFCSLLNEYRNSEIPPEALDWMDSANNFLESVSND